VKLLFNAKPYFNAKAIFIFVFVAKGKEGGGGVEKKK
jgi:hypothetical protein